MNEIDKATELINRLPPEEGAFAIDKMLVHWGLPFSAISRLAAVEERGGRTGRNASRSNVAVPASGD